jgi:hypothetical protein
MKEIKSKEQVRSDNERLREKNRLLMEKRRNEAAIQRPKRPHKTPSREN